MLKDIPGYEGNYAVTDCGKVWSHKRGKFLKSSLSRGYPIVTLMKDGKKDEARKIHRLIMLTFIGPDIDPEKNQVDHIDGNKLNNALGNLRWVSKSENMQNKKTAKGYYWNKTAKKWHAHIRSNWKYIYLGLHDTEEEARQAYLNAKKIYHPSSPIR